MSKISSKLLSDISGISHGFETPTSTNSEFISTLAKCRQVHGIETIWIKDQSLEELKNFDADSLLTTEKRAIGIQTADCLPVLIADRNGSTIAAVHAGWKGLNLGILPRTIDTLTRVVKKQDLIVAIGPAIGPCCFEVSRDVIDTFEKNWGRLWKQKSTERPWNTQQSVSKNPARAQALPGNNNLWLDLASIACLQLQEINIKKTQIDLLEICTYCGPENRASYRRATHEGKNSAGRQWSWIRREN